MRRLHLQLYLAIVGTLMAFLISGAVIWHQFASPRNAAWGVESAVGMAAVLLDDASDDGRRHIIGSLARQLRADVALYGPDATRQHLSGDAIPFSRNEIAEPGWSLTRRGPVFNQAIADGGHVIVHPRRRFLSHGLHMGLIFTAIAATLALLTYPITRGITARLGRLEAGVLQFGSGNLGARVRVEGRDEVAKLAASFNESAERIEKLVQAHRLLLANCSHELRTPLARIRLGVERITATDPPGSAELARNIAELDALIGQMLLSSRLDASSQVDRAEPVDLLALVAEEAAHFDREVSGEPVIVEGDPALLRRLVRNLLENARQHAGGASDIRIEHDERFARIVIEDAGPGIPQEDRNRIFEPFYRSKAATHSSGVGLGLAIVRQIAAAHGGTVTYAAPTNGGSSFAVMLPRSPGS
jgi:signal transduction histidine kinase